MLHTYDHVTSRCFLYPSHLLTGIALDMIPENQKLLNTSPKFPLNSTLTVQTTDHTFHLCKKFSTHVASRDIAHTCHS